jgi:hypothetical protein
MSFKRKNKTFLHILYATLAILGLVAYYVFSDLPDRVYEKETTKGYELNVKF